MGSSRLPAKIFKEVGGQPLIHYHLKRLRETGLGVYVATTDRPEDKKVSKYCQEEQVDHFRGSEFDVLERYYHCAHAFELDIIIRVTSDCPLIDPSLIKEGLALYLENGGEELYLSNCVHRYFPRGFDFEIFSFKLLQKAHFEAKKPPEREHVTPFIREVADLAHLKADEDNSDLRVTVDTMEDFDLIKVLIEKYQAHLKDENEIIKILRKDKELIKMNSMVMQKEV